MQDIHAENFDKNLKRKCQCGGNGQMIIDTVGDYCVRCDKCHKSTGYCMDMKDAVELWESGKCEFECELLSDNFKAHLAEIKSIYISDDEVYMPDCQSCCCYDIVIDTGEKLISSDCTNGKLTMAEINSFNKDYYRYKIDLSDRECVIEKIGFLTDEYVKSLVYKYGDEYLYITASVENIIIKTDGNGLSETKIILNIKEVK